MPANRKPEGTRQDNAPSRELATVTAISGKAPAVTQEHPPGTGWLKTTKEQWDDFWDSEVAKAVATSHLPALYRLFDFRDAQARALRLYKRQPMVEGSMKQPVANPAMATVQGLEKMIVALEDRIGLSPKAQANLGIQIGQARLTAAELNKLAAREEDGDDDDGTPSWSDGDGSDDELEEAGWAEA